MKQHSEQQTEKNATNGENKNNKQQGGSLVTVLIAVACVLVVIGSVAAVVITCRAYLDPPKDTEIGVIAVVAVLTFYAVIGQIGVTALQWQAMRAGLKQSDDLFYISQRPHFTVTHLGLSGGQFVIGEMPKFDVHFKNAGQTAADRVTLSMQLCRSEKNEKLSDAVKDAQTLPPRKFISDSVGAGQELGAIATSEIAITPAEIAALTCGDKLYVFIHFFYDDMRGEQTAVFRFEYDPMDGDYGGFFRCTE